MHMDVHVYPAIFTLPTKSIVAAQVIHIHLFLKCKPVSANKAAVRNMKFFVI